MLKKYYKSWTYGLSLILFTILFYRLPLINDDAVNFHAAKLQSLSGIFKQDCFMFYHWTSRILINPIMYSSTTLLPKWLYSLITAGLLVVILYYLTRKLAGYRYYLAILACWLFPLAEVGTAGYIATAVTYLYPIGFLTLGLLLYQRHKIRWLSLICFLLAFNNEQFCLLAGIYLVYYVWKHSSKSLLWIIIPWLFNFVLAALAPGNQARKLSETKRWLPAFAHYNVLDKLDVGLITTVQHYLFSISIIVIVLSVFLLLINQRCWVAWLPLSVVLMTSLLVCLAKNPSHWATTINPGLSKVVLATCLLALVWLISTMYLIHNWNLNALLIAGLLSRVALGFSPTIYASSTRTFIFCDMVMIYIIIQLLIQHHWQNKLTPVMILILAVGFNVIINLNLINNWSWLAINRIPLLLWTTVR